MSKASEIASTRWLAERDTRGFAMTASMHAGLGDIIAAETVLSPIP